MRQRRGRLSRRAASLLSHLPASSHASTSCINEPRSVFAARFFPKNTSLTTIFPSVHELDTQSLIAEAKVGPAAIFAFILGHRVECSRVPMCRVAVATEVWELVFTVVVAVEEQLTDEVLAARAAADEFVIDVEVVCFCISVELNAERYPPAVLEVRSEIRPTVRRIPEAPALMVALR